MEKLKKSEALFENFYEFVKTSNYLVDNFGKLIDYKANETDFNIQDKLYRKLIDKYVVLTKDLEDKVEQIKILSETDELTSVYNRQKFNSIIKTEFDRVKRYNSTFSLAMFDIDHFKNVNDTFGHDVGDKILVEVANIVKRNLRRTDSLSRWGGEEFMIIFPETHLKNAYNAVEKIRKVISEFAFSNKKKITCSFGVIEYNEKFDLDELLKNVDNALYDAKHAGRNCVVVYN